VTAQGYREYDDARSTEAKKMNRSKINYAKLNSRAKENFNAAKLAALMADYGYNLLPLKDDYLGADLIGLREGEPPLMIQLKSRVTVDKKYLGKNLYMAFPNDGLFYVIAHDTLVEIFESRGHLDTDSWKVNGSYSNARPSKALLAELKPFEL
jgi:hypothetical protein